VSVMLPRQVDQPNLPAAHALDLRRRAACERGAQACAARGRTATQAHGAPVAWRSRRAAHGFDFWKFRQPSTPPAHSGAGPDRCVYSPDGPSRPCSGRHPTLAGARDYRASILYVAGGLGGRQPATASPARGAGGRQ
jgi:hypothetical protein